MAKVVTAFDRPCIVRGLRCDLSLDSGDRPAPAELPRALREDLSGTVAERVGSVVDWVAKPKIWDGGTP